MGYCLALLLKFSADDILKYFSFLLQKIGFNITCKLETVCIKCQILISGKNKKNIVSLSTADYALKVVKVELAPKGYQEKNCL